MSDSDFLIFVDTNVFLDFYRIRKSEISMKYLQHLEEHKKSIITGNQVEMEYKKNRQKVILESLERFKTPDWNHLTAPALFAESEEIKEIEELRKTINKNQSEISKRIESLLRDPLANDPVFSGLNSLFSVDSDFNLKTNHSANKGIIESAKTRFMLGFPPRKQNDTSIGDAINWEWILYCAAHFNKNIVVVTRDADYGVIRKSESFINDWLHQEFIERTNGKVELKLTQRLSDGLKNINVSVTPEMEEEEDRVIENYLDIDFEPEDNNVTNKIIDIFNKNRSN